jgi:carbon storage regulator
MLVLTRKEGELILIDKGRVQVKVLYRRRGSVALGIVTKPYMEVDREEIFLKKQADAEQKGHADAIVR